MGHLDLLVVGRETAPTHEAFVAAAQARAVTLDVVDPRRLGVNASNAGQHALVDGDVLDAGVTEGLVVLVRSGNQVLPFLRTWLTLVSTQGARIVNSVESCAVSVDKLATAVALSAAHIPVVPTYASVGLAPPPGLAEPFIVKPAFGFQGNGVQLATRASWADLDRPSTTSWDLIGHEIVQPRVGRFGEVHRVVVIGTRAAAAVTRTARPGSVITNGDNATATPCDDPSVIDVAVRATAALGLHYAGVDVIACDEAPHVLEVNSWPGLVRAEAATGIDLAGQVLDHVMDRPAPHTSPLPPPRPSPRPASDRRPAWALVDGVPARHP